MMTISKKALRLAGATTLLAAAFLLAPLTADPAHPLGYAVAAAATGGPDHGGSNGLRDRGGKEGAGGSTANPVYSAAPCQSCGMGAGMSGTVDYQPYSIETAPRCDSCTKGS